MADGRLLGFLAIYALIGLSAGGAIALALRLTGMMRERAAMAVLLAAIAAFYPVFAAENGDLGDLALHLAIFGGFVVVAALGYRRSSLWLAAGLIAHGLFDLAILFFASPAPLWWHPFCAAIDVSLGLWWIVHRPRDGPAA